MLALTTRGVCVFSFARRGRRPGRPSDATATWSHSSLTIPTAARSLRSAPRETRLAAAAERSADRTPAPAGWTSEATRHESLPGLPNPAGYRFATDRRPLLPLAG
jgi:hypothetical protein